MTKNQPKIARLRAFIVSNFIVLVLAFTLIFSGGKTQQFSF